DRIHMRLEGRKSQHERRMKMGVDRHSFASILRLLKKTLRLFEKRLGVSGVNYFYSSATTISPRQRQLQP
ncbi:MAG TPA: hypothetical protein VIL63_10870, partial [Terriglobales bacterium]